MAAWVHRKKNRDQTSSSAAPQVVLVPVAQQPPKETHASIGDALIWVDNAPPAHKSLGDAIVGEWDSHDSLGDAIMGG